MVDAARALEIAGQVLLVQTTNEARLQVARQSGLGRVAISAVLDRRTCPLCAELDGKVFDADSPEAAQYEPPFHVNCRCIWVGVGDDEVGAVDTFNPEAPGLKDLVERHGHFVRDKDKYAALRIPSSPSRRDFVFKRSRDPETGELASEVRWQRPRYELDLPPSPTTGKVPRQVGPFDRSARPPAGDSFLPPLPTRSTPAATELVPKWEAIDLGDAKPAPAPREVPGHPELLTRADRNAYAARFASAPQPRGVPDTSPGPLGHVGSVGEHTWNPAANQLDQPMPEPMQRFLADIGYADNEMEAVRRQLWRWSDRQYAEADVEESATDFVRNAPKFQGRIERHLTLPVRGGKVEVEAHRGGRLVEGEQIRMERSSSFTAGWREPGNVVLVVDENASGASIRGLVKPGSAVEDEVVVPGGTEYQVLSVHRFEWRRAGQEEREEMVVVRMRESHAGPRN